VKRTYLDLLLLLLQAGGGEDKVFATTGDIARELDISQQSASRWMIELEERGFIERGRSGILLTDKALDELRKVYMIMKSSFDEELPMGISGSVVSGLKDGRYYLSLPHYMKEFSRKLGFTPFPGTLNVLVEDRRRKLMLSRMNGIRIEGLGVGKHVLGSVKCFPVRINGKVEGAVVLPERSHYDSDTIEVVSKYNLRKKLGLKDGSKVSMELIKPAGSRARR